MPWYVQDSSKYDSRLLTKQAELTLAATHALALASLVKSVTDCAREIDAIASFALTGPYAEGTMLKENFTATASAVLKS